MVEQFAPMKVDRDRVNGRPARRRALVLKNAMSRRGSDDLAPFLEFLREGDLTLV